MLRIFLVKKNLIVTREKKDCRDGLNLKKDKIFLGNFVKEKLMTYQLLKIPL